MAIGARWTEQELQAHLGKKPDAKGFQSSQAVIRGGRYAYYIGIDCGVNTGIAIWSPEEKSFSLLSTVMIHQAMRSVEEWYKLFGKKGVKVRIEDARQRTWIPWQTTEKEERGMREGAGSVKRDAKIWEDFLAELGVDYEMVAPKNNKTKMDGAQFKRITGYQKITSVHARDAGMLVYGY